MAFSAGFDFTEARAALALSQAIYGAPAIPVPTPDPAALGWTKVDALSPSGPTLLDNLWQIWRSDAAPNRYALVVRGTVDTDASILADLLFPLVDARLELTLDIGGATLDIPFHLARAETGSAVIAGTHLGFTLSLLLMLLTTDRPLLATLARLSLLPGTELLVTGHSQGASIATLATSFLRHASGPFAPFRTLSTKTYVLAPAKPGNDHYAADYAAIAGMAGFGWTLASTQGWVPQVPFTLQGPGDLNTPNPLRAYAGETMPDSDPRVAAMALTAATAAEAAQVQALAYARATVDRLKTDLAAIRLAPDALPGGAATPVPGTALSPALDTLLSRLQLSLNYAPAGALVPLFARPGGNPEDPKDYFWQHHLGNYWIYLQEQYGDL
ncbi:lipase family protein [Stappia sp. TSB10P1A]|uniref:lipase family protein n=1 Tax=Stappia sp. TSB10P1A TaxID=2003585 RepID=UPI00164384DA|nr:lipase family protein [Stappia sp. TSB10P1A]